MASTSVKIGLLSFVAFIVAYIYNWRMYVMDNDRVKQTLFALLDAEQKVNIKPLVKVAVAFGACQDIVVPGLEVLKNLKALPPNIPSHYHTVNNKDELEEIFAYFFRHGAAAERYVQNDTLFEELVSIAEQIPDARWTLGGNAPIMANRFVLEGCQVLLGAKLSAQLRRTLHPEVKVAGDEIAKDDIHLIMEYKTDDVWGPYKSPRANRFIVHSDEHNSAISSLEAFREQLPSFKPDLLVIGGLQMLDNIPYEEDKRLKRIRDVRDIMASMSSSTRIHFEMASYSEESLLQELLQDIVPYADSMGMNEQELPNLYSLLYYGNVSVISDSRPRIATVLDLMRDVFQKLDTIKEIGGIRKLTRLHVHTLAYQAIMIKKNSSWKNNQAAAAKASLTANRHVCGSQLIDTEKARLIVDDSFSISKRKSSQRIPFKMEQPVACWEEDDFELCIAPVLVCTEVLQTAGGGDNISASGLVLQL